MDFPDLIREGLAARQRGDHAAARQHFMQACQLQPRSAGAWCELAFTHRQANEDTQARRAYEQALEIEPEVIPGLCGLGVLARKAGQVDEAIALLQRAHERDPTHAGAAAELALTLKQAGRWQQAEQLYESTGQARPQSAQGPLGLAQLALARNDVQAALAHATEASRREPDRIDARLTLAAINRDLGLWEKAQNVLNPLLASAQAPAQAWMEQGLLWRARGDRARAMHAFECASKDLPESAGMELAQEAIANQQPERARAIYAALAQREPPHLPAQAALATWQLSAGQYAQCRQTSAAILARAPLQPQALRAAIHAAFEQGEREDALAMLRAATARLKEVRNAANADGASATLLEACRTLGERELAREILRDSDREGLAFTLWQERILTALHWGELQTAEAELAKIRRPPARRYEQARHAYLQARLADARWEIEKAAEDYARSIALFPNDPTAFDELSRIRLLHGRVDEALSLHRQSRQLVSGALRMRGKMDRWTHTLQGQLINEYRLNLPVCHQLTGIFAGPSDSREAPLRDLLEQHPQHTAPALALLLHWRQSGQLDAAAQDAAARHRQEGDNIPKRIVRFSSGDATGRHHCRAEHPPGWDQICFDADSAAVYLREHYGSELHTTFVRARQQEQAIDLFRLAYLLQAGGYWLDGTLRYDIPLDALPVHGTAILGSQERRANLGTGLLACVPGAPFVASALDGVVQAMKRGDSDAPWIATGPGMLSRTAARAGVCGPGTTAPARTRRRRKDRPQPDGAPRLLEAHW